MKPGRLAQILLAWYARGHRDLPWRRTSDPFRIWISEIMLQQTRAQAVIPYYEKFLARFPAVETLAQAAEEDVLAAWSGLGYYARARNLRRAAQMICAAGEFPRDYAAIRALPGIGDYTAAAIASIAFGLPHAVLDGNVLRLVARVENDAGDIASAPTRERFRNIAQEWLDPRHPGAFNQALMELGATVCLARNPLCLVCPLATVCRAREEGTASRLPVKLRKVQPVRIEGVLLVVSKRGRVLLRQREGDARRAVDRERATPGARIGECIGTVRHAITHHRYTLTVARASAARPDPAFRWFDVAKLGAIPLSTTARKALRVAGLIP